MENPIDTSLAKKTVQDSLSFFQREKQMEIYRLVNIRKAKILLLQDERSSERKIAALAHRIQWDFLNHIEQLKAKE
jgi:hypothetical protein